MTNEKGPPRDEGPFHTSNSSVPRTTDNHHASDDRFNKIAYFKSLRGAKLPDGAVRVLAILYSYSDAGGGSIRPGIKRLAEDCCMGESTVSRHLALLRACGFLEQEYRGGRRGDGQPRASGYRLAIPSTAHQREVDNASTAQQREVDKHSQPLDSESQPLDLKSQPLDSEASTSHQRDPIKVTRSRQLPTRERDQERAHARSDRFDALAARNGNPNPTARSHRRPILKGELSRRRHP